MAKVIFEIGDIFTHSTGFGVVVKENLAVLIADDSDGSFSHGAIPQDAFPIPEQKLTGSVLSMVKAIIKTIAVLSLPTPGEGRNITFTYEGVEYTCPMGTSQDPDSILLPDGRLLAVSGWLESLPPIPTGLTVISKTRIRIARKK